LGQGCLILLILHSIYDQKRDDEMEGCSVIEDPYHVLMWSLLLHSIAHVGIFLYTQQKIEDDEFTEEQSLVENAQSSVMVDFFFVIVLAWVSIVFKRRDCKENPLSCWTYYTILALLAISSVLFILHHSPWFEQTEELADAEQRTLIKSAMFGSTYVLLGLYLIATIVIFKAVYQEDNNLCWSQAPVVDFILRVIVFYGYVLLLLCLLICGFALYPLLKAKNGSS
jgi:amino acid transporter